MAPAIVKFIPPNPTTVPILSQDLPIFQKCFITEKVRRVFYIDDYSVKKRKGPQYDVLYEDSGLDEVHTFDPSTLLSMLEGGQAELVTNALPRS